MGQIRDIHRNKGWCWQEKAVMRLIRDRYEGKKLTTCVAIYQTLTELASNKVRRNGSEVFNAYLNEIARMAGKSIATVKRYLDELVNMGVLEKKANRIDEKKNLANEWHLLSPSVHNNEPTPLNYYEPRSGHNNELLIKEKKEEKNIFNNEAYLRAKALNEKLKREL